MALNYVIVDIKTDDDIGVIVQSVTGYDDNGNIVEEDYSQYAGNEYLDWYDCQSELASELGLDEDDVRQGEVSPLLNHVIVDFENRENMIGVEIIQSVRGYDEDDNEIHDYQEYVGREYVSGDDAYDWWKDCQRQIASDLGISPDDVWQGDTEFTETPWDD